MPARKPDVARDRSGTKQSGGRVPQICVTEEPHTGEITAEVVVPFNSRGDYGVGVCGGEPMGTRSEAGRDDSALRGH
jgi:hypothetical protein